MALLQYKIPQTCSQCTGLTKCPQNCHIFFKFLLILNTAADIRTDTDQRDVLSSLFRISSYYQLRFETIIVSSASAQYNVFRTAIR